MNLFNREQTEWDSYTARKLRLYIPFGLLSSSPTSILAFLLRRKLLPMRAEFYYTEQLLCYDCLSGDPDSVPGASAWNGVRIFKLTINNGLLELEEKE